MERQRPFSPHERKQSLREEFNKAIQPLPRGRQGERRSLAKVEVGRFLPSNLDLSDKSASEILVELFKNLRRFQRREDRSAAFKALSDALRAADYLVDTLPGNDIGNNFFHEAVEHLRETNIPLSKKFDEIIEDSEKRGVTRGELARKWRQNQTRVEIVYKKR